MDIILHEYFTLIVWIIGTALFAVTAYFLDITRLYIYVATGWIQEISSIALITDVEVIHEHAR